MKFVESRFLVIEQNFKIEEIEGELITFVNPFSYLKILKIDSLVSSFRFFADGIGLVWMYRFFLQKKINRHSFDFTSIANHVFDHIQAEKKNLFLVGGKDGVALAFSKLLKEKYPALSILGTAPGFMKDVSHKEALLKAVMQADFVVVGMGAPYQELFLLELRSIGWKGTGFTCGGFFDQSILKGGEYYPRIINQLNLRWLYRLLNEPKRLWKRYLLFYPYFVIIFFMKLLRITR